MNSQTFEQSIWINASLAVVDHTITDRTRMHQWLNPALKCEPVGPWSSDVGAESTFIIKVPVLNPSLHSTVIERREGLVVWEFSGFFDGRDRWECQVQEDGTLLTNTFTFVAPNAIVRLGFNVFAASLTKRDMEQQLQRLKTVAEGIKAP